MDKEQSNQISNQIEKALIFEIDEDLETNVLRIRPIKSNEIVLNGDEQIKAFIDIIQSHFQK
ncbi:MAG: hypothetical protein LKJ25_05970 [Clostridia bacterium]|nr:hypothetical protein [Clostridia bacterium]